MADTTLCSNCRTITTCLEMGCGQGRAAPSSPVADGGRPGRVDVASNFTMLAELAAAEGNLREAVERKRNELCEGAAADDGLPLLPKIGEMGETRVNRVLHLHYSAAQVRQAQREAYEAGSRAGRAYQRKVDEKIIERRAQQPAPGDSVDTPEFRERLKDIVFAVANKFDIDCETRDLIAHIDAWAARRAAGSPAAPDAQPDPDPVEDLVDTLDLGAQPEQSESAAPKDRP